MLQNKVRLIAEALGIPESTVCLVLYSYLAETVQEIAEEGSAKTLFGEMYLDEENQLQLKKKKFGLIELLDKTKYGKDGMGGLKSTGMMYVGYPR